MQYDAWRSGAQSDAHARPIGADIHLIASMARLNSIETSADGRKDYRYRCVHLQEDGNCGIYEIRPTMCRDYPYDKGCTFDGCTWDKVRLPWELIPPETLVRQNLKEPSECPSHPQATLSSTP